MEIETEYLRIALKGLVLGFSITAPVGPIGILCIRHIVDLRPWMYLITRPMHH